MIGQIMTFLIVLAPRRLVAGMLMEVSATDALRAHWVSGRA